MELWVEMRELKRTQMGYKQETGRDETEEEQGEQKQRNKQESINSSFKGGEIKGEFSVAKQEAWTEREKESSPLRENSR